jgi:hypothetical protein
VEANVTHRIGILLALLVAVACSPAGPPGASPVLTVVPATASPAASIQAPASEAPTRAPLPADLVGRWQVELSPGDTLTLELKDGAYVISRSGADSGRGRLELDGDTLVFSHSTICAGEGRYAWSIEAGELQLTSIAPDACPSRAGLIEGQSFSRAA